MEYNDFKECRLSKLGFGTMRLPLREDRSIDAQQVGTMVEMAIRSGVNYFDTAWPYHDGKSETVIGEALSRYPRESWYLADKFPGHQTAPSYEPEKLFEAQLRKCRVDYFDFYLLHNVCESSMDVYLDPKWGIGEYFVKQRAEGRIRHLGFSSHAEPEALKAFLDTPIGKEMEFCQIQLNYMDWSLQDARAKVEMLNERNIPIWVMEPLRGGLLARKGDAAEAFRWIAEVPGVTMILSGMSDISQMEDNINTFNNLEPLDGACREKLYALADSLKSSVPCTACRYCCEGCPMGLDIPSLIRSYNDMKTAFSFTPLMKIETLPADKRPSACVGCGACAQICPQGIDIPAIMADFTDMLSRTTSWEEICRQRAAAAEKL